MTDEVPQPVIKQEEAPAPPPAAAGKVKKKRKSNKPHPWLDHVSKWKVDNADRIKSEKLKMTDICKMAKECYKPRPKCTLCGK